MKDSEQLAKKQFRDIRKKFGDNLNFIINMLLNFNLL